MQRMELERIARHYRIALREIPAPTDADVAVVAGARVTTLLEGRFRKLTGLEKMRVARYAPLVRELAGQAEDDEDGLLLAMLVAAILGAVFSLLLAFAAINLRADQTIGGEGEGRGRKRSSRRRRDRGDRADEAAAPGAHAPAEAAAAAAPATDAGDAPAPAEGEGTARRRRRRRRRKPAAEGQAEA